MSDGSALLRWAEDLLVNRVDLRQEPISIATGQLRSYLARRYADHVREGGRGEDGRVERNGPDIIGEQGCKPVLRVLSALCWLHWDGRRWIFEDVIPARPTGSGESPEAV